MSKNVIILNSKRTIETNKVMSKQPEDHFRRFIMAQNGTIWIFKRLTITMNWNLSNMFKSMNALWYLKKLIDSLWRMIRKQFIILKTDAISSLS